MPRNRSYLASGDSARRVPELDGVRGCAILLVLVWHYLQNQIHAETGSAMAYLKQAIGFTWSGVDLFFVLSGFLIAGILLDNREKPAYFRAFYVRRVCRIFPLYYLNLGLFVLCLSLGLDQLPALRQLYAGNGVPLWSYFTFTQNIMMAAHNSGGPGWLSVTWSLAVEEQFYLLFPFIVRFVPVSTLPWVFLWFVGTAVYMRLEMPGLSAYINTLWRADSLMTGALLAYFIRKPYFLDAARRYRAVLVVVVIASMAAMEYANINGYLRLGGTLTHLSLAAVYGLFLLLALLSRDGLLGAALRNRVLVWLGTISYGVYLIHTGTSQFMHALLRGARPSVTSWSGAGTTLAALFVTLLVAHVSYRFYERGFTRLGHRVGYGD